MSNYFAMVGKKADDLSERIGYYGEQLVLLAQTLGLNTCWVGLTYNKVKEAYSMGEGEKLCCLIALGYGDDSGRNMKRNYPFLIYDSINGLSLGISFSIVFQS